jgi:uncharacterized protein
MSCCLTAATLHRNTSPTVEEFLEYTLKLLIDFPDELVLTRQETPRKITFFARVRQSDVGKIIGKHGHTIDAIRALLNAAASRHNQRATLEIVEEKTTA